jgi:hypothetical protein
MYAINAKTKTHRRISMFLPLEKGLCAISGTISAAARPFKGKLSAVRLVQSAEAVRSRAWIGAGPIMGGIAKGGKGAAIGALIGAGAGTGAVLVTKGKDVVFEAGARCNVHLTRGLTLD